MDHSVRKRAPGGDWNIRQQNAMVKSADSEAACLDGILALSLMCHLGQVS